MRKARESTRLWRSLEHQLEDSWKGSMISTSDTCYVQHSRRRSISWSRRSSNTYCPLNSPNLKLKKIWKNVSVWSKKTSKVVQTTLGTHLMKGLFCPVEHAKGTREHETVEKPWTSNQLEDSWQVGMISTSDTCNVQPSKEKAFISRSSRASNTHCPLNSQTRPAVLKALHYRQGGCSGELCTGPRCKYAFTWRW